MPTPDAMLYHTAGAYTTLPSCNIAAPYRAERAPAAQAAAPLARRPSMPPFFRTMATPPPLPAHPPSPSFSLLVLPLPLPVPALPSEGP